MLLNDPGTRFVLVMVILLVLAAAVVILPRFALQTWALGRTYSVASAPPAATALVFGAGLWRNGEPTPVLIDRVTTAVELYQAGKVQTLLMSGGKFSELYDEPGAMRKLALAQGVPDHAILLDYAGNRSYDTCYRARHVFGVTQAIAVTQAFHLPRALFLCQALGLSAYGAPADRRIYAPRSATFWDLREYPASLTAMWDVWIRRPQPGSSSPDDIFIPLEKK